MAKILMIEDDIEFAELLSDFLARYNIEVTNHDDPYLGLSAGISQYDLVILDLSLPGMDGLEVCKKIVQYHDTPIIISSARHDITDKVAALQIGADDYLPKPYDPQEMYARIISLLRRYKKVHNPEGKEELLLSVDDEKEQIHFNGELLQLTPGEYDVLHELFQHKSNTVSREQIMFSSTVLRESSSKTLDVMVNRIRQKMRDVNKEYIRSVRGVGYKLIV
ncbi:MAG: response regulator transcription factor [Sulfurimonadaceae bacterium]